MAKVDFKQVKKSFGDRPILKGIDLTIGSGEFLVLVGPSGCGKSTLLRLLAGLEELTSGEIEIGGRSVGGLPPTERGIAMVFQNYALYPHMTVRQNLEFGLKLAKTSEAEMKRRVDDAAKLLGLEDQLSKKPGQLSGGQKQRVAMGRAMVRDPKVFLFDEPLSNLDAQLRVRMRAEISLLHQRVKSTVVYVTHDQVEAMTLADRIAVMNGGVVEQLGTPLELYNDPHTQFVAQFIGTPSMNVVPKDWLSGAGASFPAGAVNAGFRPEAITLVPSGQDLKLGSAEVVLVEPLGSTNYVHLRWNDTLIVAEHRGTNVKAIGEKCDLGVNASAVYWFDGQGKRVR